VITYFPLRDILHNRDVTGRISKWAVELGALNIDFAPRKAIKTQALTDFMAEWIKIKQPALDAFLDHWKMYFDGSLKLDGAGASSFSYSQKENNSNMYSRYCSKQQTMKQSMKHSSMDCESRLLLESNGYLSMAIQLWSSIKSTKIMTAPKTTWTPIASKYEN
jgi:hypothetical protein